MTLATASSSHITDAPFNPQAGSHSTNYLVRVEDPNGARTDFVIYGLSGMVKAELRNIIKERYPDFGPFVVVNVVSL